MNLCSKLILELTEPEIEHWQESDSEIDVDLEEPLLPPMDKEREAMDAEQKDLVWWLVVFTSVFQTLHGLSFRATQWLLKFLGTLLLFLGRYSVKVAEIAAAFPSTVHLRATYLKNQVPSYPVLVCNVCHALYDYKDCSEKRGAQFVTKFCSKRHRNNPLFRKIITSNGTLKFYPLLVYPFCSLISSVKSLVIRPGFLHACDQWRQTKKEDQTLLLDVYDGEMWSKLNSPDSNENFFAQQGSLGFILNIDWFEPFKHQPYAVGVMYLAIMNLPRHIRFKRENIIILGLIPGPREPKLSINTYLQPHVSDLLSLWRGVTIEDEDGDRHEIRAALICVACDLPAGRKVCGFLSFSANYGCSRCYSKFGTGVFGKNDYSGFDRTTWEARSNFKHRENVKKNLKCNKKTERDKATSQYGCRYSCLLNRLCPKLKIEIMRVTLN